MLINPRRDRGARRVLEQLIPGGHAQDLNAVAGPGWWDMPPDAMVAPDHVAAAIGWLRGNGKCHTAVEHGHLINGQPTLRATARNKAIVRALTRRISQDFPPPLRIKEILEEAEWLLESGAILPDDIDPQRLEELRRARPLTLEEIQAFQRKQRQHEAGLGR